MSIGPAIGSTVYRSADDKCEELGTVVAAPGDPTPDVGMTFVHWAGSYFRWEYAENLHAATPTP